MDDTCFLSQITLNNVGQLQNCPIALSKTERQHLILTGRNGSGKTAVLQAVFDALQQESITSPPVTLAFEQGDNTDCVLAYYPASFHVSMHVSKGPRTLDLPSSCTLHDMPGQWFLQYLVNVHADTTLARAADDQKTVEQTESWLLMLDRGFQELFQDPTLAMQVHPTFHTVALASQQYGMCDFSQLSGGHGRVLSIFCDLLMRMACLKSDEYEYDSPGIVLIDGLENLLHTEVQKRILPFLVSFFPKVQFLVSTHSPFIMNSLDSAVVFDLDRHASISALLAYPYEAIIEHYDLRKYSDQIKHLLEEYEGLLNKKVKTEPEEFRVLELGSYLTWVLAKFRQGRTSQHKKPNAS